MSFSGSLAAQPIELRFEGDVPTDDAAHFRVPFTVPQGIIEIEVRHDDLSEANILDWGLDDPNGFRGWGGGNTEPAVIGLSAASRSYVPGAIPAGEWFVVVGKAKIAEPPGSYQIDITLRREGATLGPQPERRPYAEPAPLELTRRWYAGDFHVHSRESGDASASLDEIATYARQKGLDFAEISDHNTTTAQDFFHDAQQRYSDFLFLPGIEITTYQGHANAILATGFIEHRIGPNVSIEQVLDQVEAQSALFAINHPVLSIGDACIGCAFKLEVAPERIHGVEIATGGWEQSGFLFTERAIELWESLCARGAHAAALGGSDDHRAGQSQGAFQSPIGDPTTLVLAESLSPTAIAAAVRSSKTVVKLQGPADPMLELEPSVEADGDTVHAESLTLTARVRGGEGHSLRFIRNGEAQTPIAIGADNASFELQITAPESGEDRYRAEVLVNGKPRTVASYIWVRAPEPPTRADPEATEGCSCKLLGARSPEAGSKGVWFLALLLALAARRGHRRAFAATRSDRKPRHAAG